MQAPKFPILSKVNYPADLKKLSIEELLQLSNELREFIIDSVSINPGHFGASLGVVELSVALHYVYNTPSDKLIWDVGHQAYAHKILTGRKDLFHTNRKYKGISGFPKIEESEYDAFGGGHSSISISAALGMAVAAKQQGKEQKVVAIIGDGSLTGGVAFEGLNNAGASNSDLLVILNDNNMAIDPNVGALKEYLLDITTSQTYNKLKTDVWNLLGKTPSSRKFVQSLENSLKTFLLKQSNLFEALNFRYFGPIDGHDLNHLVRILEDLKAIPGPKLLHCITTKGKGYKFAEEHQTKWHAPGVFNKETGEIIKSASINVTPYYHDVFGETLIELAKQNANVMAVTPAMPSGCGLNEFMKVFPNRSFDVGIAEQHAVSFSAGLAAQGSIPFCNIYSSFMQRAYDQMIHDVALQNLQVVFCLDRAGIVGSDGATHHGAYDIAYSRCIPGITIASPMDEIEFRNLLFTAQLPSKGPFVIRYPRGRGMHSNWRMPFAEIPIGKGRLIKEGNDIAILSFGHVGNMALKAIKQLNDEELSVALYDMRFVKPLDEALLHTVAQKFRNIITIEDGSVQGGFGSAILEFFSEHNYTVNVKMLGIPDRFVEHGTPEELYCECGIDSSCICKVLESYRKEKPLHVKVS